MLQGLLRGVSIAGAAATDPFFSSVVLLMGFEGANGSTGAPGLTDESSAAHGTATSGASSTIETAQFKFGTSSYRMHTVVGNSCTFPDSADWTLSSANSDKFTIEFWLRNNTVATTRSFIGHYGSGGSNGSWDFGAGATASEIRFGITPDGTDASLAYIESSGAGLTTGVQYAIAVDKDSSGKIRLYKDGVMVGSSTPANSAMFNSTATLGIMCLGIPVNRMDGWIDELRITKGVARYASDSGYTPATARFPRS